MSCRPLSPHRRPSFTLYTYNIILYICASHITLIVLAILWPSQLQIMCSHCGCGMYSMCSTGHRTYTRVKKYAVEVPTFPKVNLLYSHHTDTRLILFTYLFVHLCHTSHCKYCFSYSMAISVADHVTMWP